MWVLLQRAKIAMGSGLSGKKKDSDKKGGKEPEQKKEKAGCSEMSRLVPQ